MVLYNIFSIWFLSPTDKNERAIYVSQQLLLYNMCFDVYFASNQTIGAAFCRKDLYIQGKSLSLAIWVS